MSESSRPFEVSGVHHLALVCNDMARTVAFYSGVLGLPLVKSIDLPDGWGQHFFFDIGNGDTLAFFWFSQRPDPVPGVQSPKGFTVAPGLEGLVSAPGSMNHVAFRVPIDRFEEYRERLRAAGVNCSEITFHDDSESQIASEDHAGVWLRSLYFKDPDGIRLEFAAWTRALTSEDVADDPYDSDGKKVPLNVCLEPAWLLGTHKANVSA